ncbi:hypothetical protein [Streptomyces sp. NPDC002602]|uniref:hypothetical protein n=1 Tax=Streptomyces sp. NPDC002602 TaxID=3364654 RepID=UPI003699E0F9
MCRASHPGVPMGDGYPRTSTVLRVLAVAYERSSAAVNAAYAVRTAVFSAA